MPLFQADILNIIEDAVTSAPSSEIPVPKPGLSNTQPIKGKETHVSTVKGAVRSVSDTVDSWRSRPRPTNESVRKDPPHDLLKSTIPSAPSLELQVDENTEVVDFNNMGQLVGDKEPVKPIASSSSSIISAKSRRAVASDFFDEYGPEKSDPDQWKRPNTIPQRSHPSAPPNVSDDKETLDDTSNHKPSTGSPGHTSVQHVSHGISNHVGHSSQTQGSKFSRTPNASYREAPLSALDDTMSRIKGALDGMHSKSDVAVKEATRETSHPVQLTSDANQTTSSGSSVPPKVDKWLPPALRSHGTEHSHRRTDFFEITRPGPPISPAPRDSKFVIHLPKGSRKIGPLTGRQASYQNRTFYGPVRWEILSFDPPVEGMTKKSLSVNDVLFRKPPGSYKTRRFTVSLPKSRILATSAKGDIRDNAALSIQKESDVGAFGRPRMSAQASWRTTGPKDMNPAAEDRSVEKLDVTSRSPPPETITVTQTGSVPSNPVALAKGKHLPKASEAMDVAFYCDSGKRATSLAISFTVGSEIDDELSSSIVQLPLSENPALPSSEKDHPKDDSRSLTTSEVTPIPQVLPTGVTSVVVIPKAQPETLAPLEPTESEVVEAQVC